MNLTANNVLAIVDEILTDQINGLMLQRSHAAMNMNQLEVEKSQYAADELRIFKTALRVRLSSRGRR